MYLLILHQHIMTRVKSLEMNWAEFEAWLISSEEKVTNLNQSLKMGGVNLSEQLKQAQVCICMYHYV